MTNPITIETLRLKGFRAYLQPQTFHFHRDKTPLSLAVFAPNAKGKSSLVDAFEFYFSEDATLSRLGKQAKERNAGRGAMEHVDAQAKGVTPEVHFSFREGTDKFDDKRAVTSQGAPLTTSALRVLPNLSLPFIIRGHELRGFVEQQTSEERYKEVAAWFGLDPLLVIQKNLRALRRQVKQKTESTTERQERLRDLARTTGNALKTWDAAVCKWLNDEVVAKLDQALNLADISETDAGYQELRKRKAAEDESLGLASLKRFQAQTEALYTEATEGNENPTGAIVAFQAAEVAYTAAVSKEGEERTKASQTAFSATWTAAKALFENKEIVLEACPVCDMQLSATPHESRDAIRITLDTKLGDLADYRKADADLKAAKEMIEKDSRTLAQCLETLVSSLKDTGYTDRTKAVETYQKAMATWKLGNVVPDHAGVIDELKALHRAVAAERKRIEEQQGEHTYANALKTADALIKLKSDLDRIDRTKAELTKLNEQLNQQALAINKAIVEHTQKLIGRLKSDVNIFYKEILGSNVDAPPIHLELPSDDDANQQRIQLLIDFSKNRKGVVPSGYLSDSQIHTLALSLRLAAIRLFNARVPIIVLDDVVTSYDADHRKNIAAMIAKHFGDFQTILLTHDERFFMLLQDHMPHNTWSFKRITRIKPDFGPSFHDHRMQDEAIQAKLNAGEGAANEIRQAEEEWLLDICRDFRVKVVIRPVERPYKYDRSELAGALAHFLSSSGMTPPKVPGISNPFLTSLQKGEVENFGSHFSDNPNESASIGDERARWDEFIFFRDMFVCPNCGKKRFIKPEPLKKPVCKKCETPFAFNTPQTSDKKGSLDTK